MKTRPVAALETALEDRQLSNTRQLSVPQQLAVPTENGRWLPGKPLSRGRHCEVRTRGRSLRDTPTLRRPLTGLIQLSVALRGVEP
jgi:hypothetical protein